MNKSKIPAAAWAEMLKRKNVEFISGKWFLDKKEIKDIDKFVGYSSFKTSTYFFNASLPS